MARQTFPKFEFDSRFQQLPSGSLSTPAMRAELENRDQQLEDYLTRLARQVAAEIVQSGRAVYADVAARDADARTKLTGQICFVESADAEYIWTAGGAWQLRKYPILGEATLTAGMTQSAAVTFTSDSSWQYDDGWVTINLKLVITGGGSGAGFGIAVSTTAPVAQATAQNGRIGGFTYVDSGAAFYVGSCHMDSGGVITFLQDATGAILGASFAVASGDTFSMDLRYPVTL